MSKEHSYDEESTGAIALEDLLAGILKRKWIVISFTLVLVVIVTIASFLQKPTFTSKGRLLIEEEPNILNFEKIYNIEALNYDYYQTQYELLASRSLADNTLERLKLYENQQYIGKFKSKKASADKPDTILKERLIDSFQKRLSVRSITNRLVEVGYSDADPKLAADVVNTLLEAYIDMNIQKKYLNTEKATDFLSTQIVDIGAEIEEKEKKLLEYGAEKNIVILSEKETNIVENLKAINKALAEAQIDRVKKETDYSEIKSADPNNIPESLANETILKLRDDYARLNREYTNKSDIYKTDFPEMQRLRSELDSVRKSLISETQNLIQVAYADYQAAMNKEKSLRDAFNRQKYEANKINSSAILYNSLQAEIENKKAVLKALLTRQGETDVSLRLKGLGATNISIVDRATVPLYPSSPKKKRNVILAFMVGLLGGLGLALVFEAMDKSVKNSRDVEKSSGLSVLGIIPQLRMIEPRKFFHKRQHGKKSEEIEQTGFPKSNREKTEIPRIESVELITHFFPKSSISENYRSILTSLLLSSTGTKPRTLLISSPLPQEGKTATVSNLAAAFARTGKTVVVIDADLRKSMQHKIFKVKNQTGLSNFLSGSFDGNIIKETHIPKLYLISAGPVPDDPMRLLGSVKMTNLVDSLKQQFEYILIDTPPILLLSDAIVLGPKTDGVVLVVWAGKTPREALKQSSEKLDKHKVKCHGVIINSADLRDHDYYYLKHYYQHYDY
jgi:capsular exopolysaccharide synthesis family protein